MAKVDMDIRYIAKLARLHVSEEEVPKLEKQMGSIVSMVENLPDFAQTELKLDPSDAMEMREDEIKSSMPRKTILQNAPQTEAGCVVVPKVVE